MAYYVLSIYRNNNVSKQDNQDGWDEYFAKATEKDPGKKPSSGIKTVNADGSVVDGEPGSEFSFSGLQVFEAANDNAAVEIAKTCPILKYQGAVSIHERADK